MRVLPVLDLLGGRVVRGVAGRRHEYRPVVSRLTASCQPLDVARAFRDHFDLTELYVADLDAIAGAGPAFDPFAVLQADGFRLWVDAGVRRAEDAWRLAAAGVETAVLGLETVTGPDVLRTVAGRLAPDRLAFSLDMKAGAALGDLSAWGSADVGSLAGCAVTAGFRRLIVLDLVRVGVGTGTGTEDLCARLAAQFPEVEVLAGGGVRGEDDLARLQATGVRGVLVASALHDGGLTREQLSRVGGSGGRRR